MTGVIDLLILFSALTGLFLLSELLPDWYNKSKRRRK